MPPCVLNTTPKENQFTINNTGMALAWKSLTRGPDAFPAVIDEAGAVGGNAVTGDVPLPVLPVRRHGSEDRR